MNYQFKEALINKDSSDLQTHLQKSYKARFRPLCMCKSSGIPMYIAKHANSFVLKRMPNTGQKHHPDCESFDLPPELSGRAGLQDGAIAEDQSTGMTSLKFDFSLAKLGGSRAAPVKSDEKKTVVEADPAKLSLLSLLHCLYEDAGFNRWSPKMKAKRKWGVIQKHLSKAAQSKIVRGNPLSEILIIPESFTMERKDVLASQHRKFLSKLRPKGKSSPLGICIGEVKAFDEARFNHKLILKHMADMPLYFDDELHKKIHKTFGKEIAMHQENERMHLIAIATFLVSASGNPTIDTLSFMMVDSNWLPFENLEELDVLNKAVVDNRYFIKGLRYNLKPSTVIASFLFSDTGENPTTFYIVPVGAGESYYEELDSVVEQSDFTSAVYDANKDETIALPAEGGVRLEASSHGPITELNNQEPPGYLLEAPPIDEEFFPACEEPYCPEQADLIANNEEALSSSKSTSALAVSSISNDAVKKTDNLERTMVLESDLGKKYFGRYEVVRPLGRGAMGQVYLCRDPIISRDVAIKCLDYKRFPSSEIDRIKSRFHKEAEAAGRLNHPGIVSIFDMGEDENSSYIAMDYINGKTLDEHTTSESLLPVQEIFRIIERVALALDYAHSKGVVHRDIKPSNIIYSDSPFTVKIADFGVAKISDNSQTKVGSIIGSPFYMSPEQIRGEQATGASDIFSLGVTLYQLLCGELPFKVDNLASLTYEIINSEPKDVTKINLDLPLLSRDITRKALHKDPNGRYQSAKSMVDDLGLAIAQLEIS